jgi:hypothetical protein
MQKLMSAPAYTSKIAAEERKEFRQKRHHQLLQQLHIKLAV